MGKQLHQSIIELNGKRFNAQTGKLIDSVSAPISPAGDDKKLYMSDVSRQPIAPRSKTVSKQVHKSTQSGKTLMRKAVKKPSTITTRKTVAMDVISQAPGRAAIEVFHSVNQSRVHRADSTRQNSLVSRFGGELRQAPVSINPVLGNKSSVKTVAATAVNSSATVVSSHNDLLTNNLLTKGLRSANSHEEKASKSPKIHHRVGRKIGLSAKAASIATASLALLAIGGFVVYQNIPNIAVHYASIKAGVHATIPEYQPGGFAVSSHVQFDPGAIALSYKANADNRFYTVTQKATNWTSNALKEHLRSESKGTAPQIYTEGGRTIYLHDGSEADWVNNGVWYSITGNSSLSTDQLIKIATSL